MKLRARPPVEVVKLLRGGGRCPLCAPRARAGGVGRWAKTDGGVVRETGGPRESGEVFVDLNGCV